MRAVLAAAPTPQSALAEIAPVSEIAGAPSILVVDDDGATRRLLVRALRTTYTVYEAQDGEQAIALLDQQIAIDCVISDIMMPRLSGTDLARRMRQDPRLKKVPIIFVTAKRGAGDIAEASASSRFYLAKPFSLTALYGRVGEALEHVTKR
jgi:CheY-like chemotaxis protein